MSLTIQITGAAVDRIADALRDAGFETREEVECSGKLVFCYIKTPNGYDCGSLSRVGDFQNGLLHLSTGWIEGADMLRLVEGLNGQGIL